MKGISKSDLQELIEVHNAIYTIPVAGAYVVPMAQALVTLKQIIDRLAREMTEGESEQET